MIRQQQEVEGEEARQGKEQQQARRKEGAAAFGRWRSIVRLREEGCSEQQRDRRKGQQWRLGRRSKQKGAGEGEGSGAAAGGDGEEQ